MGSTRKIWKQKTHDWLPDGWVLLHKKRKSGIRAGGQYKCFIEQSTGCKFYSKPEVLRYLKTTMCKSFSPETEQFSTMETTSEVIVEQQSAIHLPPGWIRETKIRRTAKGIRRYPCYIEPVSGRVFHTKKKVLHFLEVNESTRQAIAPKNQQLVDKVSEDKFNPSPAWGVQELSHPSSRGEAFIGQKPSDLSDLDVSAADQSNKWRIFELSDTEENSDSGTSAPFINGNSIEKLDKSVSSAIGLVTLEADKKGKDNSSNGMEDTNRKSRSKSNTCKKIKNFSVCSRYSRRLAGFEPERETATITNELAHPVSTEKSPQNKNMRANLANEESPKLVAVQGIGRSTDTSVLLNGNLDGGIKEVSPEIREMFEEKVQNLKTGRINKKKAEEVLDFTTKEVSIKLKEDYRSKTVCGLAEAELHQKDKLLRRRTGNCGDRESRANKSKNKKEDSLPCRASKRLAGVEPDLIGHSISCEKALEYSSKKPRSNPTADLVSQQLQVGIEMGRADVTCVKISKSTNGESLNNRCMSVEAQESAIEKQERNPEAEIMDGEKAESHLSFPLGGSWSDPCLQITSKRLTGELPVKDSANVNPNLDFGSGKSKNSMDENSSKKTSEMKTEKSKKRMEHNLPVSNSKEITSDIQPSRLCEENCEAPPFAAKEQQQLQNVEVEQPQISVSVCDSWSDPCIDFAIQTLTGALSVEDIPNASRISTNPEANILQYRTCHQNLGERSIDERNHIHLYLNKSDTMEEEFMVFQPLKQQEHECERRGCTMPRYSTQDQGIEDSFREEANGEGKSVHGTSEHLQTSVETESIQEGPPEQINMGTEWQLVPQVQLENFVTPKINTHELHMPLSSPFLEFWSDPCLDFAIKTLTGAIPLEEPLPFPGHSQEIQTSAQSYATSELQEIGFPGFFRTDVSSYYVPDKFVAVKQSPLSNTPWVPPIDVRSTLAMPMHHLIDVGRCSVEYEPTWSPDRRLTKSDTSGLSTLMLPKGLVEEGLQSLWDEERLRKEKMEDGVPVVAPCTWAKPFNEQKLFGLQEHKNKTTY